MKAAGPPPERAVLCESEQPADMVCPEMSCPTAWPHPPTARPQRAPGKDPQPAAAHHEECGCGLAVGG